MPRPIPGCRCLVLVLLGLALTSCSGGRTRESSLAAELRRNRDLWASRGVASYRYTLQISCFCPEEFTQPLVITVQNGVPTAVTPAEGGLPVDPSQFARYDTVEEIFGVIQHAIDANAATITVTYDPASGYPRQVYIDHSPRIADEELGLDVLSLEPVP